MRRLLSVLPAVVLVISLAIGLSYTVLAQPTDLSFIDVARQKI